MEESVIYNGHLVNETGIRPTEDKLEAVRKAPTTKSTTELRSYLGLINYYGKFMPNLSSVLAPLNDLLKKGAKWTWKKKQEEAFKRTKVMLESVGILVHYNPALKLIVKGDASPYGLGAVLTQVMEDGSQQPILFASCTLTAAEKNYSQLDREVLAVVFAVKKFHLYSCGRHFRLETDHKLLLGLFGEGKAIFLGLSLLE